MKQKNLILMVVAVGCGLVAAFLTSQMSARTGAVDQIEVIVAAKDLPVGTMLGKDDMKSIVKMKKVPKDGLPPAFVTDVNELAGKRLSRAVRAEETFNPADLSTGGVITLPPGMHMVSLPVGAAQAAAGFIGPGSRIDILATARLQNRTLAFPLLVNMLVVAVDTQTNYSKEGVFPTLNTVSLAVDRKQALLLALAKSRGCTLELMLRHPDDVSYKEEKYKIDDVLRMLQDQGNEVQIGGPGGTIKPPEDGEIVNRTPEPKLAPGAAPKVEPKGPVEPPKPDTVKVLVAIEDLPAGTVITRDLAAKFKPIELPRSLAEGAFGELADELLNKQFVHGLGKNQWITGALVGDPTLKPRSDRYEFVPPKDEPQAEESTEDKPRRNYHDLTLRSPAGSRTFRYEEVNPGEWKLIGEVSQSERDTPPKPLPTPQSKQPEKRLD
jgi:Flp pilus assembly protein CpaB